MCFIIFLVSPGMLSLSCASFTLDSLLWPQMIVSSILCKRPLPSIASILLRTCSVGVANFNVLTALPAHLRGFSRLLIMIGNGSCIKQGQNMYLNLCLVCLFFYLFVGMINHRLTKSRN